MPFLPGIKPGLLGEHGLAVLIQSESSCYLYDTGRGKTLLPNLKTLGVKPDDLDGLILSHAHLDHTGSLLPLLEERSSPLPVYAHPDIFQKKFTRISADILRPVGMAWRKEDLEKAGAVFHLTSESQEVSPGLWTTGEVPRKTGFEYIQEKFFIEEEEGLKPDLLLDDQAVVLEGSGGLVVITGCAHAGIVNIMLKSQKIKPQLPVTAVLGGLHLLGSGNERMEGTIKAFKDFNVKLLAVGHCTGYDETARLARIFPKEFRNLNVGVCFDF